jgi:hypothetical protein
MQKIVVAMERKKTNKLSLATNQEIKKTVDEYLKKEKLAGWKFREAKANKNVHLHILTDKTALTHSVIFVKKIMTKINTCT